MEQMKPNITDQQMMDVDSAVEAIIGDVMGMVLMNESVTAEMYIQSLVEANIDAMTDEDDLNKYATEQAIKVRNILVETGNKLAQVTLSNMKTKN